MQSLDQVLNKRQPFVLFRSTAGGTKGPGLWWVTVRSERATYDQKMLDVGTA